jgi:hypothetical protein
MYFYVCYLYCGYWVFYFVCVIVVVKNEDMKTEDVCWSLPLLLVLFCVSFVLESVWLCVCWVLSSIVSRHKCQPKSCHCWVEAAGPMCRRACCYTAESEALPCECTNQSLSGERQEDALPWLETQACTIRNGWDTVRSRGRLVSSQNVLFVADWWWGWMNVLCVRSWSLFFTVTNIRCLVVLFFIVASFRSNIFEKFENRRLGCPSYYWR